MIICRLGKRLAPTLAGARWRRAITFRILIVRSMRCLNATRPDWITLGGESMRAPRADGPVLIRWVAALVIRKASMLTRTVRTILFTLSTPAVYGNACPAITVRTVMQAASEVGVAV